jgi:hypothetical protein
MAAAPAWLETRQVSETDTKLQHLDRGEREAISLALRVSADVLLLDERRGRQAARDYSLAVSGTLGVLALADRRGLARLADAIERLKATNFRASQRVLKQFGGSGNLWSPFGFVAEDAFARRVLTRRLQLARSMRTCIIGTCGPRETRSNDRNGGARRSRGRSPCGRFARGAVRVGRGHMPKRRPRMPLDSAESESTWEIRCRTAGCFQNGASQRF